MEIKIRDRQIWLNCTHLYYFYVIASEGSMTKASQVLNLGLPTLSSQLKQLEQSLGTNLFLRKNNKLRLSEVGQIVFGFAQEMFQIGRMLGEKLGIKEDKIKIKVGIELSTPKNQLLEIFKVIKTLENCNISVVEGTTQDLLKMINLKQVDFVMTNHLPAMTDYNGIFSKLVSKSPVIICGNASFKSHAKGFPASLKDLPFILPLPNSKLGADIDNYLNKNEVTIDRVGEAQDTNVQKLMAIEGLGLICAPLPLVEKLLNKELFEIGRPDKINEELILLYPKSICSNSWMQKLIDSFE